MKRIKGYPGYYVTRTGRIYSNEDSRYGFRKMKPSLSCDGYLVIGLYKNKKQIQEKVHRLVAKAFLPNPKNLPIARHLDDYKTDNHVANLAWGTPKDNSVDMVKNGGSLRGTKNHAAKLTAPEVELIRIIWKEGRCTQQKIANMFDVTKGHINNIIKKRVWKHV
jgi:hypothetical protein